MAEPLSGRLSVVATPIGNLGDLSERGREALAAADIVACEDTRRTQQLLAHFGIRAHRLVSYHQHSSPRAVGEVVAALAAGRHVALVSDAGTPGISDPGNVLVRTVREQLGGRVAIEPIPGPSALLALASVSGLPTDRFLFLGFLPHKKGRQTMLAQVASSPLTVILYESVHRIAKLLAELRATCGPSRYVAVGRELTKQFERVYAGPLAEVAEQVLADPVKGEYVLAIGADGGR